MVWGDEVTSARLVGATVAGTSTSWGARGAWQRDAAKPAGVDASVPFVRCAKRVNKSPKRRTERWRPRRLAWLRLAASRASTQNGTACRLGIIRPPYEHCSDQGSASACRRKSHHQRLAV